MSVEVSQFGMILEDLLGFGQDQATKIAFLLYLLKLFEQPKPTSTTIHIYNHPPILTDSHMCNPYLYKRRGLEELLVLSRTAEHFAI